MLSKKKKAKLIAMITILNLLVQVIFPILSVKVFALEEVVESTEITEEQKITRNYEIKEEETWDVSANNDGSVIAKWTRSDRTIVISGIGLMKVWNHNSKEDWHNTQYTNVVEKVVIEEGVTSIGKYAFYGCSSLECITIPEGVGGIWDEAFSGCISFKSITIPSSVLNINSTAFSGCNSLESINVNNENKKYSSEDGILFNKEKTEIIQYPVGKRDIIEYNIPEGVTNIESWAFSYCSSLTSIKIPSSVTSIGNSAFNRCSSLTSIEIPKGVTCIEDYAFYGCSSLDSIKIPDRIIDIKSNAFYGCTSLDSIIIPSSVTSIGSRAFDKSTIIYAKADSEGHRYAEEGQQGYIIEGDSNKLTTNYEIKEEEIWDISEAQDESITAKWTRNDKTIVISGQGKIKDWTSSSKEDWHNTQYTKFLEKVSIEKGITDIGYFAFYNCSDLISVEIEEGVTSIGVYGFEGCSSLKSIEIPSSVTEIGHNAFYGCSSLDSITIPEGVTSIRAGVFNGCSSLKSIVIPSSIKSIENELYDKVFNNCDSLEKIIVHENNENYTDEDGILFSKDKTEIIRYPEGKKDITEYDIPKSVTSVENSAFSECSSLKNITIPEGITSIENSAFYKCSSLESIVIPEGVMSIEYFAFSGCSSLESITIPEGVTSIEQSAFSECSSLKSITIPSSITSIEYYTFSGCSSLESIIIQNGVITIEENAFDKSTIIYCKSNTEAHRYAEEAVHGYIIDDTPPHITYTSNKGEIPQKKYEIIVNASDNEEEVGLEENSLKYQWTQSEIEPTEESFKQVFTNGQTISKNEGDGEWYLWILAKDKLGNMAITRSEAFILDNSAPIYQVAYSTTEPTRENVIAVIAADERMQEVEGWTLSQDKLTLTKEYSKNIEETITVKDLAGNESQTSIKITNIDNSIPICQVEYSTNEPTRENVIVTITSNESMQEVEGWTLLEDKLTLAKEYSENIKEEVIVKDLVGNETKINIIIDNIDKTAANVTVSYSTIEETYGSVTVRITSNEELKELDGWILSTDKKTLQKTFTQNTAQNISIQDLAGNITNAYIVINNIKEKQEIKDDVYEITEDKYILGIESNTQMETCLDNLGIKVDNPNNEIVKTGDQIIVNGITYTLIVKGDITKDGQFDIQDLSNLCSHLANLIELKGDSLKAADMNIDKMVDMIDLSRMCLRLANLD